MQVCEERRIAALTGDQQKIWRLLGPSLYSARPLLLITVRELVQNSRDAIEARRAQDPNFRQGKIQLIFSEDEQGRWSVVCNDNGCGMTEDVILDRFLQLGGTLKAEGAQVVGGFGIAKAAIIGACSGFQLKTLDNYLDSSMLGHEPIKKLPPGQEYDGCSISLYYDPGVEKTLRPMPYVFTTIIPSLISSELGVPCDISLYRHRELMKQYALSGTLEMGNAIYSDENFTIFQVDLKRQFPELSERLLWDSGYTFYTEGDAYVRLNGLTQFEYFVGAGLKSSFLVDVKIPDGIRPGDPAYPFLPSREGLIEEFERKLKRILEGHSFNPLSSEKAIKERQQKNVTLYYNGREEGKRRSREELQREAHLEKERKLSKELHFRFSSIAHQLLEDDDISYGGFSPIGIKTCVRIVGKSQVNPLCDKNLKLLLAWAEIIRKIHEAGDVAERYGVGFVISDSTIAERYINNHGEIYYLINPQKIKISDHAAVYKLLFNAAHEIAHADYHNHNELFTARHTELYDAALQDKKLFKRLRSILLHRCTEDG